LPALGYPKSDRGHLRQIITARSEEYEIEREKEHQSSRIDDRTLFHFVSVAPTSNIAPGFNLRATDIDVTRLQRGLAFNGP
jgi:hypothetical protein